MHLAHPLRSSYLESVCVPSSDSETPWLLVHNITICLWLQCFLDFPWFFSSLDSLLFQQSHRHAAGHSQERYVRRMVAQLMSQGWVAVVYNRRGHRKEEVPSQKSKSMKSVSLDFIAIERQHSGSAKSRSRSRSPEIKASSKGILPEKGKETRSLLAHMQHNDDVSEKRKVWPMYCDMEDMHEVR